MQVFLISLFAVAVLLVTAVPGYILIKKKMISENCIPGFSKILIFITQPCLAVYTFKSTEYSPEKLLDIGIFALMTLLIHAVMLGGAYLTLRKRYKEPIYRIMTIATTFGNCAFFGIPILEALFPSTSSDLIIYTTVYALVMNVLGWTVGSAIISGDTKYVSVKKIFLNPAMLGSIVATVLFVFEIPLTFTLSGGVEFTLLRDVITTTARMATPLSMIIMGMRLGTMKLSGLFTNLKVWSAVAVKQLVMPLIAFLIAICLPADPNLERTFFVICACPVASIVLNYAELVGCGQEEGANSVLLGTMASILTLPITALLLNFL